MQETRILLRRSQFLIFSLRVLPVIILIGIIFALLYKFNVDFAKCTCFVLLIIAIVFGFESLKNNNKYLVFGENSIIIYQGRSIKKIKQDDIRVICENSKAKKIIIELNDTSCYVLVDFSIVPFLGEDLYFKAKANLYKVFPDKCRNFKDEYVQKYLDSGVMPEFIKNKNEIGRVHAIIFFILEIIAAIIPLGCCFNSIFWIVEKLFVTIFPL